MKDYGAKGRIVRVDSVDGLENDGSIAKWGEEPVSGSLRVIVPRWNVIEDSTVVSSLLLCLGYMLTSQMDLL